ncbi:MAG: hypothetical protein WC872_04005 [Candidatus Absconditabacterales bacterium]
MLKTLKDHIRNDMAHKHLGRDMIGSIAINTLNLFFNKKIDDDDKIQGYVRFDKIFVKLLEPKLKIELYKKKTEVLNKINLNLSKVGYKTKIKEIMFK